MRKIQILSTLLFLVCMHCGSAFSQSIANAANDFMDKLDKEQKSLTVFPFDDEDRFNFYYFPVNHRKGLPLDKMTATQKDLAFRLLKTCLADATVKKVHEIIELEVLLKKIENRQDDDHFRDPGKYYLAIFGVPGEHTIWGWRFEGHHVSFHFSARENSLVAGTPGFLGANPAIVLEGSEKGKEVLREEKEIGFELLHSFSRDQLRDLVIDSTAPHEIITGNKRKAVIEKPAGLSYARMTSAQQQKLLQVVSHYVRRYKKPFADKMLADIQKAGVEKLLFAWAGEMKSGPGHPHYYRIHGPTIIIEYDNTQNNANHVHTVVRDILNDFGGDALLEHYKSGHGHQHSHDSKSKHSHTHSHNSKSKPDHTHSTGKTAE